LLWCFLKPPCIMYLGYLLGKPINLFFTSSICQEIIVLLDWENYRCLLELLCSYLKDWYLSLISSSRMSWMLVASLASLRI